MLLMLFQPLTKRTSHTTRQLAPASICIDTSMVKPHVCVQARAHPA